MKVNGLNFRWLLQLPQLVCSAGEVIIVANHFLKRNSSAIVILQRADRRAVFAPEALTEDLTAA
jgi:hypothetical protein